MKLSDNNKKIFIEHVRNLIEFNASSLASTITIRNNEMIIANKSSNQAINLLSGDEESLRLLLKSLLIKNSNDLIFEIFSIIDGVSDPDDLTWTGIMLVDKPLSYNGYIEFLHDEF